MNEFIHSAIVDLYDGAIAADPAGGKIAEAKSAIRDEVLSLVATTDRDIQRETDLLLDSVITMERARRSRSMKKQLDYFLDYLEDPESGATVDPILDLAFSLGDQWGVDKTLRNWTADDFQNVAVTRYRVAAEVTEAAKEFDDTARRIVAAMRAAGVATLGGIVESRGRAA